MSTSTSNETSQTLVLLASLETTTTTLRSSLVSLSRKTEGNDSKSTSSENGTVVNQNPQKSLSDALNVLEAQCTKLTLVLTNPPLSNGAVREVVTELVARVVPAVFSGAAHIVDRPDIWGKFYTQSLAGKVDAVFAAVLNYNIGMKDVVNEGNEDGKAKGKAKSDSQKVKDELYVLTGKVFELARTTGKFATDGVAKCLLDRTKEAVELLQDAMEEIKDWSEDVDEDNDEDEDEDEEEEEDLDAKMNELSIDDLEDIKQLPANRKDLRELLTEALRRVELVVKLFQASSKRRIKRFPDPKLSLKEDSTEALSSNMAVLDYVVTRVEDTSEEMDEMAHGFYQLDRNKAEERLVVITKHAKEIAESLKRNWEGQEDDFTVWLEKWESLIERKKSVSSVSTG